MVPKFTKFATICKHIVTSITKFLYDKNINKCASKLLLSTVLFTLTFNTINGTDIDKKPEEIKTNFLHMM
jgi:hypothetical protein